VRIIVYGAGGIGGPLAAFLHEAGVDTLAIARGEHLKRCREVGLQVITPERTFVSDVPFAGQPSEIDWREGDAVALTMKAQDTEAALRELIAAGADPWKTPIFCVQNCIANEPIALRYFARVYGVMIVIPGIHLEPGVVYNPIRGPHGYLDVGRYPSGVDSISDEFVGSVRSAGYAANGHENVMESKGAKFLGNLGNALGAITDGKGDNDGFMKRVRTEGRAALTAAGLPFEEEASFNERVRKERGEMVEVPGIGNRGSSWQSLTRRQGSIEADFLNGEVVLLGRKHGVATPYNAVLQRVANEMARNGETPGKYSSDELASMAEALR
jgi:2-dehydropantoate 2-reductase